MYFGDYSIILHTELLHSLKKKKVYVVIYFYFLAALGLRCCMWAFSSCGSWASRCSGCSCGAWVPGPSGFSSCRTWAQLLWFTSLVAPRHVGSSWTRDWTSVSCIAKRIVYPWPPEKPYSFFNAHCRWTSKIPSCRYTVTRYYWWTFRVLSVFSYHKQCHNEYY